LRPETTAQALEPRAWVERLRVTHARLSGLREAAVRREAELIVRVGQAKGRLLLADEVNATLEGLQQRAHQRAVGAFERLLSAILTDVLPGKGAVRLELGTERGAPALDVQIDNAGAREDALEGSGGAVTNVLSAGLRFAALSRTSNRKLMVLDEPDCWLKPERVPAFIRVLAEVAEKTGTQTILISHHEPSLFEGLVSIVRLTSGAGGVPQTQVVEPRGPAWPDDETPGIRSIRLVNFRAHADTTLPLFPGVTALIGDNDLGKSTLAVAALRAVAYGEADDTLIRHGATEARVIVQLERGRRIEWVRRARGNPRITYALYEHDQLLHEGRPSGRGQVPAWITEALGIARVDELDIQLGSQKAPVFLLNESASTRARLLSVGRESGRLHALIEAYGELKRRDREQVRDGEAEIAALRRRIEASAALPALRERLDELAKSAQDIESLASRLESLGRLLARLDTLEKRRARLEREAEILSRLPTALPTLADTQPLARLIRTCEQTARIARLRRPFTAVSLPELSETGRLAQLIANIERTTRIARLRREFTTVTLPELADNRRLVEIGQRIAKLARRRALAQKVPSLPGLPNVIDLAGLSRQIEQIESRQHAVMQLRAAADAATKEAETAHEELAELIEAMGGQCPVCGGELKQALADGNTNRSAA